MCWPVDRACSRLGSPFSRLAMFSRLLPGCLTPTCQQRRHNYICQATCPGCPLFPGCPAAQCSLFSRLLPSRLFTRHYTLGSDWLTQPGQCRTITTLGILASRLVSFPDCPAGQRRLYSRLLTTTPNGSQCNKLTLPIVI